MVRSLSHGRLAIDLLAGGSVEARVSDETTDIGCGTEADAEAIQDRSPGEEPEDPTEDELESDEDADPGEGEDDPLPGENEDPFGEDDPFEDDDSPDDDGGVGSDGKGRACPESALRRGARVQQARLLGGGGEPGRFGSVALVR